MAISNDTFNGWSSKPTRLIRTWVTDNPRQAHLWNELAQDVWQQSVPSQYLSRSEVAVLNLAAAFRDEMEVTAEDTTTGLVKNLLLWTLANVNFDELAESWLSDVEGCHV